MLDFTKIRVETMMAVSVVIPTYNRAHTIKRALDSAFEQDFPVHEIIVVDDGSTDNTAQLLKSHFPSVHQIKQKNQGVSAARNRGIERASGDWIALLDSDDSWLPNKLSRQVEALMKQPHFPICHTNELWIRNGQQVNPMKKHEKKGGDIFLDCLPLCAISPSSVLIKKSLFEEIGTFDETLPACEDYDLWLRICSRHPVLYLDDALTIKYGGHDDQLSKRYWGMDRFRIRALDKLLRSKSFDSEKSKATRAMLHEKCEIMLKGAIKHQNKEIQAYCNEVVKRHPLPECTGNLVTHD